MEYFYTLTLYFFIYCILGWLAEVFYCRLVLGNWTNRGFLNGPYCPIYGFGGIIVIIFLEPFISSPILIFILAFLLTSILEYVTSYIMEKLFDAKWWDYSHLPFNINGRVCLLNSTLFGILGLFLTYLIHPHIKNFVLKIPTEYLSYFFFAIFVLLSIDLTVTLNTVFNLKSKLKYLHELKDKIKIKAEFYSIDSEIIKQLEELKTDFINKKELLKNRFIDAFPNMEMTRFSDSFEELRLAIHEYKFRKKQKNNYNKNK